MFEKKAEKYKKKLQELKSRNLKKEQDQEKKIETYERLLVNIYILCFFQIFIRLKNNKNIKILKPKPIKKLL